MNRPKTLPKRKKNPSMAKGTWKPLRFSRACSAPRAARGELAAIWQKAVMICMECIGIG